MKRSSITNNHKLKLNKAIAKYIKIFENKHGLYFDYWVADLIGSVAVFGDYYFSFEDIRLDLETNQTADEIFKWYDITLELGMKDEPSINYYSWIKGYRNEKTKLSSSSPK